MAIKAYNISRAFEVYVNGEKLIQSGQVVPYQPTVRYARLIASIPEAQLQTGNLVIAVRARAPITWWTSAVPAFNGPMLKMGDESALRNQNMLSMIGENTFSFLESLLALGVGLVALALFINQRERKEYFWIFILGILSAAELPLQYLAAIGNVPVSLWIIEEALILASLIVTAIMVQAFLRKPFGRVLWLCIVLACIGASVCDIGYEYGAFPLPTVPFSPSALELSMPLSFPPDLQAISAWRSRSGHSPHTIPSVFAMDIRSNLHWLSHTHSSVTHIRR